MIMPTLKPVPFPKGIGLIKTLGGYTRKWMIVDTFELRVPGHDLIVIPAGFVFDGASIPKIFRGLLSPVGGLLISAIVHDYVYGHHCILLEDEAGIRYRQFITKAESDTLFLEIANQVNGLSIINKVAYLAVKYFGFRAWNKHKE